MKQSFKNKTKKAFSLYALVPLVILVISSIVFFIYNSNYMVSRETAHSAVQLEKELTLKDEAYTDFISTTVQSDLVKETLLQPTGSNRFFQHFYEFNSSQRVKSDFYLIDNSGNLIVTSSGEVDQVRSELLNYINRTININQTNTEVYTRVNKLQTHTGQLSSLLYGGNISSSDGETMGALVLLLHEDDFIHLISDQVVNVAVITDAYGNIIATNDNTFRTGFNKYSPEYNHNGEVVRGNNLLYEYQSNVGTTSMSIAVLNVLYNRGQVVTWLLLFFSVMFMLIFILLWFLSEKLSVELSSHVHGMVESINVFKASEKKHHLKSDSPENEFQLLVDHFNSMLDQIEGLITDNKALEESRRTIEIRHLEMQFNPHFIFNILETIRYLVLIDPKKAEQSILSLSRLLRYSVDKSKEKISLEDEMVYLKDYLSLNRLRLNNNLSFNLDIDPAIKKDKNDLLIPKLLFQPIIENSIKHGYIYKSILEIEVSIKKHKDRLRVVISDNGGGIPQAELDTIIQELKSGQLKTLGLGLFNVHRRLELLFSTGGLTLHNRAEGLEVSFLLPFEKSEGDEQDEESHYS